MKKMIAVFIIILMLGGCGCSMNNDSSSKLSYLEKSKKEFIEQADKHLKSKYPDIKYEVVGVIGRWVHQEYDLINATWTNTEYGRREFSVRRYKTDDGYVFEDNFFAAYISNDFKEIVNKYVDKYFDNYYVKAYCDQYFPNNFTSKNTLLDAKNQFNDFEGFAWIVIKPDNNIDGEIKDIIYKFIEDFKNENLAAKFRIFYLKEGVYENLSKDFNNFTQLVLHENGYQFEIRESIGRDNDV